MRGQKLYAGVILRETRTGLKMTQKVFAAKLGVSLPYLNQMENNHRPISTTVVLALAQEFGFDVTQLSVGEAARMVADMREALADPVFAETAPPTADLQLTASNSPALARAFLSLHQAYRQSQERLAALDEVLGREDSILAPSPWDEVRDFFHYCDNYIDSIDIVAEKYAAAANLQGALPVNAAVQWLRQNHHVTTVTGDTGLRIYDPETKILTLATSANAATRLFQIAHQTALIAHDDLLDATLDFANFKTPEARAICKIGLANYFAGAAVMPYKRFLKAAQNHRHDLEKLSLCFGTSIEQVAHRLSTLQRPGHKGIPFFFVRVDQAGTITKRHSATSLQFARFGGACPLWNVHRAFETPGHFLRQLAQTPDGLKYFCLARDVSKSGGAYNAPTRRYAIGLGCEVRHADALVYTDDLDLGNPRAFEPIGISCRICERTHCHQRSIPPLEHALKIDHNYHGVLPYGIIE